MSVYSPIIVVERWEADASAWSVAEAAKASIVALFLDWTPALAPGANFLF